MRQYTKGNKLTRPGITRFASNFITLKSLLTLRLELRCMFVGPQWSSSSFATSPKGIDATKCIYDDEGFWEPCLKIVEITEPFVALLRVANGEKPSMGYIYESMNRAKEAIKAKYVGVEDKYGPIWDIIDRRWQNQLHKPIHSAAYYLNRAYCFREDFKTDEEVLSGLYNVISKMATNATDILLEMDAYNNASGPIFSSQICKEGRTKLQPDRWWQIFGPSTKNLQQIAICIMSHPSSAFGCECNWSMFEHIHSKRHNRLSVEKMNRLVFVHYNLRIRTREILDRDTSPITLEEVDPKSGWIIEAIDLVFDDEDLQWVDQADREGQPEAMAIAAKDQRAPVVPSGTSQGLAEPETTIDPSSTSHAFAEPETIVDPRGTSQADAMANQSSRTYLRCLTKRHFIDYTEPEVEVEVEVGDEDDDDSDDNDEDDDEDSD